MSPAWEGVDERDARHLAAWAIRKARGEGDRGFYRPLELLAGIGFMLLMRDDVESARQHARAAVLLEESRDRQIARWLRERAETHA